MVVGRERKQRDKAARRRNREQGKREYRKKIEMTGCRETCRERRGKEGRMKGGRERKTAE